MQGLHDFVPTETKTAYINKLLNVGFDTLDFGSFVSPKAIPQLRDTAEVLKGLQLNDTKTKLLAIVANQRGAEDASNFEEINYLGYPFSISETFQLRNTNAGIAESLSRVEAIQNICVKTGKKMVAYISMGFGNPYGDLWNVDVVQKWVNTLANLDIRILSLSDTIGVADRQTIEYLFSNLIPPYPDVEFGAHFHTTANTWHEKIDAAYKNGCKRFDGALKGYGGCPMAKDDLTGNMPTENLIYYFDNVAEKLDLNADAFYDAMNFAVSSVFPQKTLS